MGGHSKCRSLHTKVATPLIRHHLLFLFKQILIMSSQCLWISRISSVHSGVSIETHFAWRTTLQVKLSVCARSLCLQDVRFSNRWLLQRTAWRCKPGDRAISVDVCLHVAPPLVTHVTQRTLQETSWSVTRLSTWLSQVTSRGGRVAYTRDNCMETSAVE
jgi:hypothetical protein